MKVIGLGAPDDVRVRFDACEVDVLGWKPRYASWRQGLAQGLG